MIFSLKRPDMLSTGHRSLLPLSWMTLKSSLSCWKHLFTFMSFPYKWLQFLPHNKIPFFFHRSLWLSASKPRTPTFVFLLNFFPAMWAKRLFLHLRPIPHPSFWIMNLSHLLKEVILCYLFMSLYIQHTFSTWLFPMIVKCLPMAIFFL